MKSGYTRTALFVTVVGLALSVGCSTPQAAAPDGGTAVQATTPKVGGVLRVRASRDPSDWDITSTGRDVGNNELRALAQQSLLAFKTGPDVGYNQPVIAPQLAERWEVSPDAKTYTFHLRKGVKFADAAPVNGRAFTSADVRWSLEYIARLGPAFSKLPASNVSYMLEGLEKVETPDPATAVVSFKEPFAPFLNYVAHPFVSMLAHEVYDKDGNLKDRLTGTGPFQVDEAASQKGARWVMRKNPAYWDGGKPYLDQIDVLVLPEDVTAIAAFRTKQVDLVTALLPHQGSDLKQGSPDAVWFAYSQNPMHIYLNNTQKPFDNPKVRQAFFLTVDRDEYIKVLSEGSGGWATAGTLPGTFTQEELKAMLPHDPAKAKALLAEAGYPNGLAVDTPFPTDRGDIYPTRLQLMQAQAAKGGFTLTGKGLPFTQYSDLRRKAQHTVQFANRDLTADVDSYLSGTFDPSSGNNYDRVNEPKLNQLIQAQRREPDPAKRTAIVREAARYLATECFCGLAVYYGNVADYWQPAVKGYRPNWFRNGWAIDEAWLDR